ncbi:MAG TPA: single-stranded DNA-binding protein, partial [Verrucomicrobiota bacterium]|nr:single-stranded DNA-binding protein [Verrucomicrobiota bacterium]
LPFRPPVAHVYRPLDYAWEVHAAYVRRYGAGPKRVVLVGMNPGPFGMVQTGIPFGEVAAVRDWLGLPDAVAPPRRQHPARPVEGFACRRSEVSGRRLWGLFAGRFGTAEGFFRDHFVLNWCPLAFLSASGANLTPDKLPAAELGPLAAACDAHLAAAIAALRPAWVIGVGGFAAERARQVIGPAAAAPRAGQILHPSPASPAANRGWAEAATRQLEALGVW